MTFVITQDCCHDASCLSVCPVDCIHPTRDEPEFGTVEMLYVDPRSCIDCGACADACPVDAVTFAPRLLPSQQSYAQINADYYVGRETSAGDARPDFPVVEAGHGRLLVAVVGTGPSAAYVVDELLRLTDARITVLDRSPVAGGLVRFGVAPDHPATRRIAARFARTFAHPRVRLRPGTEVGRDITHDELARRFDAVVYAVGAGDDRLPDVPGWGRPGTLPARTFVGWYNGDPTVPDAVVDLTSTDRVVVVGTGNVALDAARVLVTDPDQLARTDIAPAALAGLRGSTVREVVVLGRRGPDSAAWSAGELTALRHLPGVELVLDAHSLPATLPHLLEGVRSEAVDWTAPPPAGRRIVLSFDRTPGALDGETDDGVVTEIRTTDHGGAETVIPTGLVLAATGYRGRPVPGLPFDESTGTVPHERGRVVGGPPHTYVVGWIKRGARGGIGANRPDAEQTVATLLEDAARRPPAPPAPARRRLLRKP